MSTTTTRKRSLSAVEPAWIAAWKALAADVMAALVAAVLQVARQDEDDEVVSHAMMKAATLHRDGQEYLHTARAALRFAREHVAAATSEVAAGLSEVLDLASDGQAVTTLARSATPHADARCRWTAGDLVDLAVSTVDPSLRASLERAVSDYREHAAGCQTCDSPTAGRRPTLTGVTAHMEGLTGNATAPSRRATERALQEIPAWGELLDMIADPAPLAAPHPGHGSLSLPDARPVTGSTKAPHRATVDRRTYSYVVSWSDLATREEHQERVTEDGALYWFEEAALHHGDEQHKRHEGEQYGVSTAPMQDTRRDAGMIRPRPRKNGGAGSTGPTTNAF